MSNVQSVPEGYASVTPALCIKDALSAIDYYKRVFGATEVMRMLGPDGKLAHAELKIGNSKIMLGEENAQMGMRSPLSIGGTATNLYVYLENVDAVVQKAVEGGAKLTRPVQDMFYGDRTGTVIDPFGHMWSVATHIEDVSPEELQKRLAAAMRQSASA